MKKLLNRITSYLKYLNKDLSLHVSIHFSEETLRSMPNQTISALLPYNSHTNPYCISVKGNNSVKCILSQRELIKECKSGESFLRTCHAGVYEYICPIMKHRSVAGFAAVSGYRNSIPPSDIQNIDLWKNALIDENIPQKLLSCVIPPLCIMTEKLLEDFPESCDDECRLILQFLNEYHTGITLDDLCKHFCRSKSHISHMFKSSVGMTVRAYCNELKLEDSKKLLSSTDLSVTEIAFESGFNDVSYFIHLFRKKFGISPLKYRKSKQI